jgi:hypothetical protein
VSGQEWAYLACIIAIALGALVVFVFFPKRDDELALLERYQREDAEVAEDAGPTATD